VDAHDPHAALLDAVIDIFFLTFFVSHFGHAGFSLAFMGTRTSNSFPHFSHRYS